MQEANIAPIIAAVTAISASVTAKKNREKEEQMAKYNSDDLNGWEFKIIRANTRKFRNLETVERIRQEEARAGWELVEKFDDYRLRFKRRVDRRSMDQHLDVDPYRTTLGSSGGGMAAGIIGAILVVLGILFAVGRNSGFDRGVIGGITVPGIVLGLIVLLGVIVLVVVIRRNR